MKPKLETIQEQFPVGDYIEYETTGNGLFSGMIVGYQSSEHGISLDLGDRRFPIWNAKDIESAERYHKRVCTEVVTKTEVVQLTLF